MNKKNIAQIFSFLTEALFLLIVFFVPLYFCFYQETNEVFEFHKFFIFRTLFFVLLVAVAGSVVFGDSLAFNKRIFFQLFKKYYYLVFVFLLFAFLSVFWSIDPRVAFLGSMLRQFGWLNFLFLSIFFVLLSGSFSCQNNGQARVSKALATIVLSSFLASLYAVFQYFSIDVFSWAEPASKTGRAFSSLGQPNLLGAFLILSIPITLYFLRVRKNIKAIVFCVIILATQLLALLFSGSRSAYLGFSVSFVAYLFLSYFKNHKKIFYFFSVFFVFFIAGLLIFNIGFKNRIASSANFDSGSVAVRSLLWPESLRAIAIRPWGYGLESQREALITRYVQDWGVFSGVNVVFDRAHNLFLDWALSLGVGGLIFLFIFIFIISKILVQNIKQKKDRDLSIALFASFLSYFIFLQFNFSSLSTALLFLTLLSIAIFINFKNNSIQLSLPIDANHNLKNKHQKLLGRVIFIFVFIFSCWGVGWQVKTLTNDYYFFQVKKRFLLGDLPGAVLLFSQLNDRGYLYDDYLYYFADTVLGNYTREHFDTVATVYLAKSELKRGLIKGESRAVFDSGNSFFSKFARAKIYSLLGDETEAENLFLELISASPQFPDIYFNYAKHKIVFGDLEESLNILFKTRDFLALEEVESDISFQRLKNYKLLVDYEIKHVSFKINNNIVE